MKLSTIKFIPAEPKGWGWNAHQEIGELKGTYLQTWGYDNIEDIEKIWKSFLYPIEELLPEAVLKAYAVVEVNGKGRLILKNESFKKEADKILAEGIQLSA